jgi:hypothetical protein
MKTVLLYLFAFLISSQIFAGTIEINFSTAQPLILTAADFINLKNYSSSLDAAKDDAIEDAIVFATSSVSHMLTQQGCKDIAISSSVQELLPNSSMTKNKIATSNAFIKLTVESSNCGTQSRLATDTKLKLSISKFTPTATAKDDVCGEDAVQLIMVGSAHAKVSGSVDEEEFVGNIRGVGVGCVPRADKEAAQLVNN